MPTIDAVLARAAGLAPDHPAVREWESGREIPFRLLDRWASALAGHLQASGFGPGERLGIHLPNCAEFLVAQFGVMRAGGVAAYVNFRLLAEEAARQLRLAGATAIVTTAERAAQFRDDPELGRALFIVRDAAGPEAMSEVLARAPDRRIEPPSGLEEADAIARFTSGSTGAPKGILVSHRAWLLRAVSILAEEVPVEEGSTTMVLGPLSHQAGLFVLPTFLRRGTLLLFERFDLGRVAEAFASVPIARTQMVPTMLRMFVEDAGAREALRRAGLRQIVYGGSPVEPSVIEDALGLLPDCKFLQGYGSHEAGSISSLDDRGHRDPVLRRSAGRPLLAVEVRVRPLPGSDLGEIEVRAPWVPRARITERGREPVVEEWVATGDLGEIRDGYVFLRDRAHDVIISGGFNVYPTEVERVIDAFPGVVASAVVSEPDRQWGERVIAFVVTKDRTLDVEGLRLHCRGHLSSFKVPKEFRPIDAIPLNANGKPDHRRLSEPMWRGRERRIN